MFFLKKKSSGGFGSFANASDFMNVILPMRVNFLFDHCLQTPSTFFWGDVFQKEMIM